MIISCASVLESPRRGATNTLPYDFIIELLVIKEKKHCSRNSFLHTMGTPLTGVYTYSTNRTMLAQKLGESVRHQPISDCRQMSESEWFTGETPK